MTGLDSEGVLHRLKERAGEAVLATHFRLGDATAEVEAGCLRELMERVRTDDQLAFDMLMDVTAVDMPDRDPRFDVVYHLYSTANNHRLRVKVGVCEEVCLVDSLSELWPSANWMEREVFDLYGIAFRDHPDLRRILLPDTFEGHPLRKDFPKRGLARRVGGG